MHLAAAVLVAAVGAGLPPRAGAAANVTGQSRDYTSPNGVHERCVVLDRMPGGAYSDADGAAERRLCDIDFYSTTHALCPKVFSTSPGTLVYPLAGGPFEGDPQRFEREACVTGGVHKRAASGDPVSYKMSVNTRETSATFANSSLLYYHFAHYLESAIDVPVAVLRTMDRAEHTRRVAERGAVMSAGKPALRMNHAGWLAVQAGDADPSSYRPTEELYTFDGQIYGVLLHPRGQRYGPAVNGTRDSGWGDGQNRDFQRTAPFLALRSDLPLEEAIAAGLAAARKDARLARDLDAHTDPAQMVFWMREITEIVILDYLFSQQDRIGNIDYLPYWYWLEDGKVRRREATGSTPPSDIAAQQPRLLRRTELGDNDAGVRLSYANYAKRTGMIEGWRHASATTYRKVQTLAADFAAGGPLNTYVKRTFGLSEREFERVVANVREIADRLRQDCAAGHLRFDLEPQEYLETGAVEPRQPRCEP